MENASKALIIAGAILLSILIISLGIMVFQQAKNTVGSSNLNKQEIETFNSQWQSYEGKSKTASEVISLYQAIIASNAAESKSGTNRWISLLNDAGKTTSTTGTETAATAAPTLTAPTVENSKTYTITAHYGSSGLIVAINWTVNT